MTIGELAKRAAVAPSAIRYYERLGILRSDGRTAGNYRTFTPSAIERLRFVRAAQASGLSLDDVRTLLSFRDGSVAPCAEVRALVEARLDDVVRQMKHLRQVHRALRTYRDACDRAGRRGSCPVLEDLGGRRGKKKRYSRRS